MPYVELQTSHIFDRHSLDPHRDSSKHTTRGNQIYVRHNHSAERSAAHFNASDRDRRRNSYRLGIIICQTKIRKIAGL